MKSIISIAILLLLLTSGIQATATDRSGKYKMTVSLETRFDAAGVSLILHDDQIGVYHHFILEKSLDGKAFFEVARADEEKEVQGSREILFKDFPFERNSIQCVFYRIRAVDDLGWFDFTNTVTVMKKEDLARKQHLQVAGEPLQGTF
jgi:hypothetical protein